MAKSIEDEVQEVWPMCRYSARYSGEDSTKFWKTVRASKNRMLYVFGCALQDLESRVLNEVNADMQEQLRDLVRQRRARKQRRRSAVDPVRRDEQKGATRA